MSDGGPFGLLHWFEGIIGGIVLMIIGGVVKLIQLDHRVAVLEKKDVICSDTHDEVIKLKEQIKAVKESQEKSEKVTEKIFLALDKIRGQNSDEHHHH